MIKNPSFESTESSVWNLTSAVVSSKHFHSGNFSIALSSSSFATQQLTLNITLKYSLSFYRMTPDSGCSVGDSVRIGMLSENLQDPVVSFNDYSASWTLTTFDFTPLVSSSFLIVSSNSSCGRSYYDDFSLLESNLQILNDPIPPIDNSRIEDSNKTVNIGMIAVIGLVSLLFIALIIALVVWSSRTKKSSKKIQCPRIVVEQTGQFETIVCNTKIQEWNENIFRMGPEIIVEDAKQRSKKKISW